MLQEKLEHIKQLTGYSLAEIKGMSIKDFVLKIGRLQATGITPTQYEWLKSQRSGTIEEKSFEDLLAE